MLIKQLQYRAPTSTPRTIAGMQKELVAEVVRAEQQALSGVGSTFNPMADKTTVIGQAPIVATSKDNTTTNLTKQQATSNKQPKLFHKTQTASPLDSLSLR